MSRPIFGRHLPFPGDQPRNPSERAFVERQAINAPIQGSAADIIRRAMIRMEDALTAARLDARMLLQVHDELVFEVPDDQVEAHAAGHPAGDGGGAPSGLAAQGAAGRSMPARRCNWDEAH
jgi:DNA polymerase I-like protein with 3'-5' exonuclease and polymerase domains